MVVPQLDFAGRGVPCRGYDATSYIPCETTILYEWAGLMGWKIRLHHKEGIFSIRELGRSLYNHNDMAFLKRLFTSALGVCLYRRS
jgi:hypothetical protein